MNESQQVSTTSNSTDQESTFHLVLNIYSSLVYTKVSSSEVIYWNSNWHKLTKRMILLSRLKDSRLFSSNRTCTRSITHVHLVCFLFINCTCSFFVNQTNETYNDSWHKVTNGMSNETAILLEIQIIPIKIISVPSFGDVIQNPKGNRWKIFFRIYLELYLILFYCCYKWNTWW